jgi:hypothetical protein
MARPAEMSTWAASAAHEEGGADDGHPEDQGEHGVGQMHVEEAQPNAGNGGTEGRPDQDGLAASRYSLWSILEFRGHPWILVWGPGGLGTPHCVAEA